MGKTGRGMLGLGWDSYGGGVVVADVGEKRM